MDDLKSGDEIFNYYGNRKNADFFLHNGFVYEEHNDDSVRIKIGLSPADPLYSLKEALCKKINLPTNDVFELSHKSSALNKHLLAIVRVFLLNKGKRLFVRTPMFTLTLCAQTNCRSGSLARNLAACSSVRN